MDLVFNACSLSHITTLPALASARVLLPKSISGGMLVPHWSLLYSLLYAMTCLAVFPAVPKGQAPSAAAAPSSSSRQTQAVPTGCTPWALPPLDSLSAAVAAHKAGVDKAAERRAEQVKEGLSLKRQADSLSKVYDWGGAPFEKVAYMRNRYVSGRFWTQF